MFGYRERELIFAKFVRWLLKLVYGEEFVVVTRVQWDAMTKTVPAKEEAQPEPSPNTGCQYREWGWHDGGPDFRCRRQGKNYNCEDPYSATHRCELSDKPY